MPFWRIVPPPPRPWAQSVAPAALVGRRIAANPPRPAGAAARTHYPCALPPGGGLPTKMAAFNKCPTAYSPATAPALLGISNAGAVADKAAIAPASPPPTPKGVDFSRAQTTNAPPIIAPCQSPLRPTHNGRSR